jgi:hypothetical protein
VETNNLKNDRGLEDSIAEWRTYFRRWQSLHSSTLLDETVDVRRRVVVVAAPAHVRAHVLGRDPDDVGQVVLDRFPDPAALEGRRNGKKDSARAGSHDLVHPMSVYLPGCWELSLVHPVFTFAERRRDRWETTSAVRL